MGHALIDEFCRASELQPTFLRRCQRVFREEVQTQLDEREALIAENAGLTAEIADLKAAAEKPRKKTAAVSE